jgi:cytochrome c-type biogenesis protein CcmE
MRKKVSPKRQRLYLVIFAAICLALAAYFIAGKFKDNLLFFYTPAQVLEKKIESGKEFRLGGLVKDKSVQEPVAGEFNFVITDTHEEITVKYKGILPSLFREGQGVIARGKLVQNNVFLATEILAKHDENSPPAWNDLSHVAGPSARRAGRRRGGVRP